MACNHFRIPFGAPVSSTKGIRCSNGQLHQLKFYLCTVCNQEAFLYPAQAQRLALCNLSQEEKDKLGEETIAMLRKRLENGIPVTSSFFVSEYPPGMDYAYVTTKSDQYQQEKEGKLIEIEDSDEEEE